MFRYFRYLSILVSLVEFIQQAQGEFPEKGSGSSRLQWVKEHFLLLVDLAATTGLLKPQLADALRAGAEAIITIVVQLMKATDGGVTPLPPQPEV